MRVKNYIMDGIKKGKMHMTLIDPDKQKPEIGGKIASIMEKYGTHAIMVGGSTGTVKKIDATVKMIKKRCGIPVILFPASASCLSRYADAVFYISMLNSRNIRYVIGEQVKGAVLINKWGLEAIPVGYIIVSPGMMVGKVGDAELVGRKDKKTALAYSLAVQYLGMEFVYFEAGSGSPKPVPPEMISYVFKELEIPIIVGGGIRNEMDAKRLLGSGAKILVTGTAVENMSRRLRNIVDTVRYGIS